MPHASPFDVAFAGTLIFLMRMQVGYRNMYHQRRKFILRSSNASLVSFASPEVSIPALEQRNLGLQVNSAHTGVGMKDVLVFINDEEDRNEECYRIRVHVYKPETCD